MGVRECVSATNAVQCCFGNQDPCGAAGGGSVDVDSLQERVARLFNTIDVAVVKSGPCPVFLVGHAMAGLSAMLRVMQSGGAAAGSDGCGTSGRASRPEAASLERTPVTGRGATAARGKLHDGHVSDATLINFLLESSTPGVVYVPPPFRVRQLYSNHFAWPLG